jgi:adenylate kinase family enzyme
MDSEQSLAPLLAAKRILVLGSSGSGKTTFSRQLGHLLGIAPIHLDACFWHPGWISTPQEQWHQVVASLVKKEDWIMDGTYERSLHLRVPRADCLVVLEQRRLTCLWRIVKRKLTSDDQHRPDAPAGQPLDWEFFRYVWRYPAVTRPFVFDCIRRYGPDKPLIRLSGSRDIQRCLQYVQHRVGRDTSNS